MDIANIKFYEIVSGSNKKLLEEQLNKLALEENAKPKNERHKENVKDAIEKGNIPVSIFIILDALTDDQRMHIFYAYCRSCGKMNPDCQCWNDE